MKKLINEIHTLILNSGIDGLMFSLHTGVCVSIHFGLNREDMIHEYVYITHNEEETKKNLEELKTKVENIIKQYKND